MRTSVFVIGHKPFKEITPDGYHTLRVGQSSANWNPEYEDSQGINISEKNPLYCELTGLYWIWKNFSDAEILGLVHYRRYFVKDSIFSKNAKDDILTTKEIENILREKDVIVPYASYKSGNSGVLYRNLSREKQDKILLLLEDIIAEKYPQDINAYRNTAYGYKIYHANMFIAKTDVFKAYAEWLFDIFDDLEFRMQKHNIEITPRLFGYIAEYMTAVFIHSRISPDRIGHCSVAMITEGNKNGNIPYGIKKMIKRCIIYKVYSEIRAKNAYIARRTQAGYPIEKDVLNGKVFRF